jgi:hypothetical protein
MPAAVAVLDDWPRRSSVHGAVTKVVPLAIGQAPGQESNMDAAQSRPAPQESAPSNSKRCGTHPVLTQKLCPGVLCSRSLASC